MRHCRDFQEEIDLRFPSFDPADLEREHIEKCDSCRKYLQEMQRLDERMGSDEDFDLSNAELERLAASVENRIDGLSPDRSSRVLKKFHQIVAAGLAKSLQRLRVTCRLCLTYTYVSGHNSAHAESRPDTTKQEVFQQAARTGFGIGQYLPLVVAVILVVSVGLISLFLSDNPTINPSSGTLDSDSFYTSLDDPSNSDLDDGTIEILLDDLTSEHSLEAGELLLDDLTEEEFDFLMKNYDVGDIL